MAQHPADTSQGADISPDEGEARCTDPDAASEPATEPRTDIRRRFALAQIDAVGIRPAEIVRLIMTTFGVGRTTAYEDLRAANREVRAAIDEMAPEIGASVKDQLGRLAREAEKAGDYKSAVTAVTNLGKFCGLHEKADPALARELTDDQLRAAIAAHTEQRAVEMSDADFAALIEKRRAAKEHA